LNGQLVSDNLVQAWRHAEIHGNGWASKRLAGGFPHGCMAGLSNMNRGMALEAHARI
jgi:hypothetical protein